MVARGTPGPSMALEDIVKGIEIIVAACTADCTDGFFGELLATSFRARGARPGIALQIEADGSFTSETVLLWARCQAKGQD